MSDAAACSSIVLCNSASADRVVVAASRLLGATAACAILLSFAAGPLHQGCDTDMLADVSILRKI